MDEPVAPTPEEPAASEATPAAPETAPEAEASPRTPPALTITVQSWATPIVGLVMLILGAVGGFLLRPVIMPGEARTTPEVLLESSAPSATAVVNPNAAEIMKLVTEQTRHFAGAEDAPVTIIEFSDYQ